MQRRAILGIGVKGHGTTADLPRGVAPLVLFAIARLVASWAAGYRAQRAWSRTLCKREARADRDVGVSARSARSDHRCETKSSRHDSQMLLTMAAKRAVDPDAVAPILRKYFAENEQKLWADALREHALV